jgi:hypothetical protein
MRCPVDAYGLLLTRLGGQRWVDRGPAGLSATLRWLDTVLSDIRATAEIDQEYFLGATDLASH